MNSESYGSKKMDISPEKRTDYSLERKSVIDKMDSLIAACENIAYQTKMQKHWLEMNADKPLPNPVFESGYVYNIVKSLTSVNDVSAELSRIQERCGNDGATNLPHPNDAMVVIKDSEDYIAVQSPLLYKRKKDRAAKAVFSAWVQNALLNIHKSRFIHNGIIDLYMLNVYSENTLDLFIADCDNLDTKLINDPICMSLGIDDNGINVKWILGAARSNFLTQGTYTLITRRQENLLSEDQLLEFFSGVFHTVNP